MVREKLYLKTPRDKIISNGYIMYQEWVPKISSITGEDCVAYLEKLQWLDENPRKEFRIENGHGHGDVNHWYWPSKQTRILNGENSN